MEILTLSLGVPIGAALLGPDNVWWKPVVFSGVGSFIHRHGIHLTSLSVLQCVVTAGAILFVIARIIFARRTSTFWT